MRLGAQIVNLVGQRGFDHPAKTRRIREITIVQEQTPTSFMWIFIDVIDAGRVETGATPDNTVHGITFGKKEFTKIRAILACDSNDESRF